MRTNNIFTRIRYSFYFIFGMKRKVRIMTCECCGSTFIVAIENSCKRGVSEENGIDLYWVESCKCLKCGATCREFQMWTFAKEETQNKAPEEDTF